MCADITVPGKTRFAVQRRAWSQ